MLERLNTSSKPLEITFTNPFDMHTSKKLKIHLENPSENSLQKTSPPEASREIHSSLVPGAGGAAHAPSPGTVAGG